ncbi:hypothetical protein [Salinarimonas sp.]|uniref:hypothetical protein n=1 Tax=Salinarimonas sp. TaxID=2766526 RepID=UPI0032D90AB1
MTGFLSRGRLAALAFALLACASGVAAAQTLPPPRAGAPSEALERFLIDAHPVFQRAEWRDAAWDGDAVATELPAGHALAGEGRAGAAVRISPEVTASGVSLLLPWRETRIEAARAHLVADWLVLEGFTLANAGGTLGADALVLSADALRALGAAVAGEAPAAFTPSDLFFDNLAIEVRRPAPNGAQREFASRFSADALTLVGLTARDVAEDGATVLDLAGIDGSNVSGAARFAGSAAFALGELSFRGSPRRVTQAIQAAIGLAEPPADAGARAITFDMEDFRFEARRPGAEPATLLAAEIALRGHVGDAASRVSLVIDGVRADTALFAGSPAEPIVAEVAARADAQAPGTPDTLTFDLDADAAVRPGRARVRLSCLAVPGVIQASGEVDVSLPEDADLSEMSMRELIGAQVRDMRIAVIDQGFGDLVEQLTGTTVRALVEDAASSVLQARLGLPAPVARLTLPPLLGAVEILETQGSLAAASSAAGPLPLAAASLLGSAAPAEGAACE